MLLSKVVKGGESVPGSSNRRMVDSLVPMNTQKISEELNIKEAVSEKEGSSSANPSWLNKCQNKKALKRYIQ